MTEYHMTALENWTATIDANQFTQGHIDNVLRQMSLREPPPGWKWEIQSTWEELSSSYLVKYTASLVPIPPTSQD